MTYKELFDKVAEFLPGAQIEEDDYGQLVIYTNLREQENELVEWEFEEDI